MKALLFGQIGLRKKRIIDALESFTTERGKTLRCFTVGKVMYECDTSIKPGRILQKEIIELRNLRARAWDRIITEIRSDNDTSYFLINTHATFRWKRSLFEGFTKDEILQLNPDICITVIDDIQDIKYSINFREQKPDPFTLKDIIVWREEEILAADLAACMVPNCKNYVVAKDQCPEIIYKLIFETDLPKAYLSYPITLVKDSPEIWADISSFRQQLGDKLICFDPIAISEGELIGAYTTARESKRRKVVDIEVKPENKRVRLRLQEIEEVIPNISGQIIARDFRLIDQSDMVIAYIPERDNIPQISTGVERELAYAQQSTKDTYVIWPSTRDPSPFQQATRTFANIYECLAFYKTWFDFRL